MARLQQQQQQMFNQRFQNQNMFRGQANIFHTINTSTPINIQQMNPLQRAAFNQYLANMKAQQNTTKFANNAANQSTGPVITEPPNENEKSSSTGSTTSTIISAPETSTVTISEIT